MKRLNRIRFSPNHLRVAGAIALFLTFSSTFHHAEDLPPLPEVVAEISFEWQKKHYKMRILPDSHGEIRSGSRYAGNPNAEPELRGKCFLVLKSDRKELDRFDLGSLSFTYSQKSWNVVGEFPLRLLKRAKSPPLVCLSQYASSNGNSYRLFYIDSIGKKASIRQFVFFDGEGKGKGTVFAAFGSDALRLVPTKGVLDYQLWVQGYSNARLGNYLKIYVAEIPGKMALVGLYSSAAQNFDRLKIDALLKEIKK